MASAAGHGRRCWRCCLVAASLAVFIAPPSPRPRPPPCSSSPISTLATTTSGRGPGEWDQHIAEFAQLAGAAVQEPTLPAFRRPARPTARSSARRYPTHPDLVVWPESPAPFDEGDPRFQQALDGPLRSQRRRRWWSATSAGLTPQDRQLALLQLRAGRRRGRRARRPLRQDSPRSLRRIHSLPESAHLCPQAHRAGLAVHARQTTAKSFASPPRTASASLRRLHLLRSGLCRRGAPVRADWAPKCWSTSATTAGTATPAPPGST